MCDLGVFAEGCPQQMPAVRFCGSRMMEDETTYIVPDYKHLYYNCYRVS